MNQNTNTLEHLEREWINLINTLWEQQEIDIEIFKRLIRNTHKYFLSYCADDKLPKTTIRILMLMNQFANHPEYIDEYIDACEKIVEALLEEIILISNKDLYLSGQFYIELNDNIFLFDIETFDIDSLSKEIRSSISFVEDFDYDIFEE